MKQNPCACNKLPLPEILVSHLTEKNLKIATAESCTGGLISKKITDIPGSSRVFECGICSYSDKIKNQILKVDTETLKKFGAVSEQVAKQMAKEVRRLAGADIAISTTGFAGPKSNDDEKVGLVYICIDTEKSNKIIKLDLDEKIPNIRDYVRKETATQALNAAILMVRDWQ